VHLAKKQKKTVPLIEMEKQPSFLTLYMQAGGAFRFVYLGYLVRKLAVLPVVIENIKPCGDIIQPENVGLRRTGVILFPCYGVYAECFAGG
jgi:hypothetical protein